MEATEPYKFIGFGAMDATKPYKFMGNKHESFLLDLIQPWPADVKELN